MPDLKDTKLVMFHCPEDVRAEMDALCELNMIDRTEFLTQAIYKLMDYIRSEQKNMQAELVEAYPELEEELLTAADDSQDEA